MTLIELCAGPLNMVFDSENAFLRYVSLGDKELVRCVFAAVRDHNWDTVPFAIESLQVNRAEKHFSIAFSARSLWPEVSFGWNGIIEGKSNGQVRFQFHGLAHGSFLRNRIGLCVLHSSHDCSGKACRIDHCDETVTLGQFPKWISPHQPFRNVRSISQFVEPDLQVKVTLQGDTFEMEDQRNWTDASFKTYSTPLEIPFPVKLQPGDTISQSVQIELSGLDPKKPDAVGSTFAIPADPTHSQNRVEIEWRKPVSRPSIGFQLPIGQATPTPEICAALKSIKPDHLRVDLRPLHDAWHAEFMQHVSIASEIGAPIELALFSENASNETWKECIKLIAELGSQIARVLLYHPHSKSTPSHLIEQAYRALKQLAPLVPVVVGTDAYFAELNRERPAMIPDGQVCYSINPQVHAFDNLSLSETLSAQRDTIDTAANVFQCDVVVSPVTLRPRFNPNATSSIDLETQLKAAIDPRQASGFGAAWTVGVFANLLTHPRVRSVTLYEAYGPRGVIGDDAMAFPMTSSIERLLRCKHLFYGTCSSPLKVVALGTETHDGNKHVLCGNLCNTTQSVQLHAAGCRVRDITIPAESVEIVFMEDSVHA